MKFRRHRNRDFHLNSEHLNYPGTGDPVIPKNVSIHLCLENVDFRKQIDGLAAVVQGAMSLDPFSGALFLFLSRDRSRMKILYWDRTGFALWQKRLEKSKFPWVRNRNELSPVIISSRELELLLDGIDIFKIKPHESLSFPCI